MEQTRGQTGLLSSALVSLICCAFNIYGQQSLANRIEKKTSTEVLSNRSRFTFSFTLFICSLTPFLFMTPAFPLCSLSTEHLGRNVRNLNVNPNTCPNGHGPQHVFKEAKALSSEVEHLRSLHKISGAYRKILFSAGWEGFFS